MELITLIKMLFKDKPSSYEEPELMMMKHYPFKGYRFMMWCGKMIYREDNKENIETYMTTEKGARSKRHEKMHLFQAQTHGKDSWIKYYWRYFIEWVKGNPIMHPSSSAYYTIPYEVEAYALEDKEITKETYDLSLLKDKYTLKDRKKTYNAHRENWRDYVKEL